MTRKVRDHSPPGAQLPGRADVPVGRSIEVRLLQLAQQAGVGDYHQKTQTGPFRRGVVVDRDTVRSIMREQGLVAAQPRRKVRTTTPAADLGSRPDLVKRDFTASQPGVKWVGDITYIRTWEGFVYLATVLDCCTKKAVGYAMADNMRTDSVMRGDRYGGPQVPDEEGEDDLPPQAAAASTPPSSSPGT